MGLSRSRGMGGWRRRRHPALGAGAIDLVLADRELPRDGLASAFSEEAGLIQAPCHRAGFSPDLRPLARA